MKKKKIAILIPARYKSSRFMGKPLAPICGKPMIEWVYSNCQKLESLAHRHYEFSFAVVTDDKRIEQVVLGFGGQSLMVEDDVPSGTERIALAYERYLEKDFDLIINVQGDEPLIKAELLLELADYHFSTDFEIATVVSLRKQEHFEDFHNPNMVKVIFNEKSGACQYFSRSPIPHVRGEKDNGDLFTSTPPDWFLHRGIYSYRPAALIDFSRREASYYEGLEKLEQLRAIDMGFKIGAIETSLELIGVDIKNDIKKLEEVLSGPKK